MIIQAGNVTMHNVEVYSERIWHEGAGRPAIRLRLPGAIAQSELDALLAGEVAILDDAGVRQGDWSGYTTLCQHELILAQVSTLEQVEAERDAAQAEVEKAQSAVREVLPAIVDNAGAVNAALPLLPKWDGALHWQVDDICAHGGVPYRCIQAHDAQAGWTPDATPALWTQYHGTSKGTARHWIAPTGAHDMYRAGEYMVWTDGNVYRCLTDTAYAPDAQPEAWAICDAQTGNDF